MTTRSAWAAELVSALGGNAAVCDGIVAQAAEENTQAAHNPLATTMAWAGASDFNSAGVKSYASEADGIAATVATLRNGLYPAVLEAIDRGDPEAYVKAIADGPWGTWHDETTALAMLHSVRTSASFGEVEVTGSSAPTPAPAPPHPPAPAPTGGFDVTTLSLLRQGATGGTVRSVQAVLNAKHGAGLATDGVFGPLTLAAVKAWQSSHDLATDGVVGPLTYGSLLTA